MQLVVNTKRAFVAFAILAALALAPASTWADKDREAAGDYIAHHTISAEALLAGDVKNIANTIGGIKDLVLTQDKKRLQYVLYRVPNRYEVGAPGTGFAVFKSVELRPSGGDQNVILVGPDGEADDTLKLTRSDLRDRSVNRLLGKQVTLWDEHVVELIDLRVNAKSGVVTHFVIGMDENDLFHPNAKAIPASHIKIARDGSIHSSLTRRQAMKLPKL